MSSAPQPFWCKKNRQKDGTTFICQACNNRAVRTACLRRASLRLKKQSCPTFVPLWFALPALVVLPCFSFCFLRLWKQIDPGVWWGGGVVGWRWGGVGVGVFAVMSVLLFVCVCFRLISDPKLLWYFAAYVALQTDRQTDRHTHSHASTHARTHAHAHTHTHSHTHLLTLHRNKIRDKWYCRNGAFNGRMFSQHGWVFPDSIESGGKHY